MINGRKWWTSGINDTRCEILILMGKTDPGADRHKQQSMILVPRDARGVRVVRNLPVFGFDDAPRITSYNVCYTKLLRRPAFPRQSWVRLLGTAQPA